MNSRKGFTLLELLIAATILGLLAVVATVSFQRSSADSRMAAAKVKAEELVSALQRFRLDHDSVPVSGEMTNLPVGFSSVCDIRPNTNNDPHKPILLIACGYLDNGGWSDEYVQYYVCKGNHDVNCNHTGMNPAPWVCMYGRDDNSRLPNKYKKGKGYRYCINRTETKEVLGS